jgi:hypothetical protein
VDINVLKMLPQTSALEEVCCECGQVIQAGCRDGCCSDPQVGEREG